MKQHTPTTVPDGYMKDSQGRLVPLDMVQPLDVAREKVINELMADATKVQGTLTVFRDKANKKIDTFVEKAAKKFSTTLGGKKGNLSLVNYAADAKVTISQGQDIYFNEQLNVAKKLIDECVADWSKGANQNLVAVIDHAFQTDSEGNAIPSRLLGLKKLNIKDTKWRRAMRALTDSQQIGTRKPYLRFYKREGDGEWTQVPLDVAKLPTAGDQ